jgi:hypothetical protein
VPLTNSFTAGIQLVNGCNDVRDNNSGKTVGLTSTLTRAKWGWSQIYLTGPEKTGTNAGFRRLYNSFLTIQPKAWANIYLETLWPWIGERHAAKISGAASPVRPGSHGRNIGA